MVCYSIFPKFPIAPSVTWVRELQTDQGIKWGLSIMSYDKIHTAAPTLFLALSLNQPGPAISSSFSFFFLCLDYSKRWGGGGTRELARLNPCISVYVCFGFFSFFFLFLPHYSPRDVWDICTFPFSPFQHRSFAFRESSGCLCVSLPPKTPTEPNEHKHTHTLGPLFIMSGFNELEAAFSLGGLVFQTDSLVVECVPNFQRLLLLLLFHRLLYEIEKSREKKKRERK